MLSSFFESFLPTVYADEQPAQAADAVDAKSDAKEVAQEKEQEPSQEEQVEQAEEEEEEEEVEDVSTSPLTPSVLMYPGKESPNERIESRIISSRYKLCGGVYAV